jgi:hypothetical protein
MTTAAPAVSRKRAAARNRLELLFARVDGPRPTLTPGELYRRMSAEFKERRSADHAGCVMPMVICHSDSPLSINWGLEALTARCAQCEPLILDIAWRHAGAYDVSRPHLQPTLADSAMKDSDISVTTNNGVVTLNGTVKSQDQIAIATNLAQRQEGVQRVESNISVR